MARNKVSERYYSGPIRRLLVGGVLCLLVGVFLLWRIDGPRVERFRAALIDRVIPSFDWAVTPAREVAELASGFQSYRQLATQNRELRRELQQMRNWKEAALQLEQENAKLIDLNNVHLDPKLTYVTGVVLADSGSPFRRSVLLNLGTQDGIIDGWPAMDGIALVGRISGVGRQTSRVLLLTDTSSRIPAMIQPSGQRVILAGDNSAYPMIEFLADPEQVRPGDRVISSGDGGVFPADLLIGQVAMGSNQQLRVRLSADYQRLEFLRVLRSHPANPITDTGGLVPSRTAEGASSTQMPMNGISAVSHD